ncbi:VVA0879 family protein [Streptomyces sp. NPDC005562]|uniref:VVA0879 family protein n=1 Tax=Streptomyces sp. NPDC005562 TaxID=3154890 RepID=UPI0033BD485F
MSTTTIEYRKLTRQELLGEMRRRFGDDSDRWAFVCPSCSDVATIADWREALTENETVGADGERITDPGILIGQQCLGRTLGALRGPQEDWKGRGCDWAAFGLIPGPWEIEVDSEGDEPRFAPAFALADGDDSATAVHRYLPTKFGELEIEGTRIVRVPDTSANWGTSGPSTIVYTLRIPDFCPCGVERGAPEPFNACNDGEWYNADKWENPCGHKDSYQDLLAKAGLSKSST